MSATAIIDEIQTIAAKVAPYLAFAELASAAIPAGAALTGPLAVIAAGVAAIGKGASGALTSDEVTAELRGILARLSAGEAADDAEADAIVASRRAPTVR